MFAPEVLVLLPTSSASQASQGALLAVPAVLIILREILVSALREWTALAGEEAWGIFLDFLGILYISLYIHKSSSI